MRMMSFALTERQLMDGTKTVTRRTGWQNLRPGERLLAVRKAMGLKAGEKIQPLCEIEVVSAQRIHIFDVDKNDTIDEGFPHLSPQEFIDMFCKAMRVKSTDLVTRIEFRKVPGSERVPVQSALPMLVA
jgi:hypothetical protein